MKSIKEQNHALGRALPSARPGSNAGICLATLRCLAVLAFAAAMLARPARALTFNVTYDSTVTSLTNAAEVEAAFGAAVQMFQNQFTNPITINLTVSFSDSVDLGESQTALVGNPTYAQLTSALRAARTTADDTNAVASLPATDPTGGPWWIPRAEAKALNLLGVSATDTNTDGSVMFATPGPGTIYALSATNRAVAGEWDFIGIAEHEISEAIGRTYDLGIVGGYVPNDLFRFTNNGARCFDRFATNVYFSLNNGAKQLKPFYPDTTTGDVQDWASSAVPDAFDAYVNPGQQLLVSPADIKALDILGYDLAPVPAPHLTGVTLAGGTLQFSFTNTPAVSYTVLVSTNLTAPLTDWTILGNPVEYPAGHFQFTDTPAADSPQQFYRVRSP